MMNARKRRQKQTFPEPKAHLPASSGDGSLNPHSSGERPRSPPGLVSGDYSSRPWSFHRAVIEHPLHTSGLRDEQDILTILLLRPVREMPIEIPQKREQTKDWK